MHPMRLQSVHLTCSRGCFFILYKPAVVQSAVDLHSLGLDEVEDVALGGRRDVEPDTGHQMAERAASWEVGAPPNVQPLPQHLHCKESHDLHLPQYTSNVTKYEFEVETKM